MNRVRVLYSFPHKLGAARICYTAWQQVNGLAKTGAQVIAFPGSVCRPVHQGVTLRPTLARGNFRIPYRLIGSSNAFALHDGIVARRLRELDGQIDIVHTWPRGALKTLETAAQLGIPTVLERPNAYTRYGFTVVQRECARLGVTLPPNQEYGFSKGVLEREEEEFQRADHLLCPSDFVVKTFLDAGFPPEKLLRHSYGFDPARYYPAERTEHNGRGLTMLFVGVCAVRKGVHFALEAWLRSPASETGVFQIAGAFLPSYAEKLAPQLCHPSVRVLGHRSDVPDLMRNSDILVLPTLEEGSPLVVAEGMASGCVPLVSEVCTEACKNLQNGLVHRIGDVAALTRHITMLHNDRVLLERLRTGSLQAAQKTTWTAAGEQLLTAYRRVIHDAKRTGSRQVAVALAG